MNKKKYIRRVILLTPEQDKAIEREAFERGEASYTSVIRDIVQSWKAQKRIPVRELEQKS